MMTINKNDAPKRAYAAPKLVVYGDMAKITKGGAGSVMEAGSQNSKQRP